MFLIERDYAWHLERFNMYKYIIALLIGCLMIPMLGFSAITIPTVILSKKTDKNNNKKMITHSQTLTITIPEQNKNTQTVSSFIQHNTAIPIDYTTGTGSHPLIHLRGFGDNAANNSLILINGQPIENADTGIPNLNFLSLNNLQAIQINESSQSILYGDQAVGGVINLVTQTPTKKSTIVNFGYGSFNQYHLNGMLTNHYKKLHYSASAGYFSSDHYRDHNKERDKRANLSLHYLNSTTTANLEYYALDQYLELPGTLTKTQLDQNRRQAKNNLDYSDEMNNLFLGNVTWQLNPLWQGNLMSSFLFENGRGHLSLGTLGYRYTNHRNNFFIQPSVKGMMNIMNITIFPIIGIVGKNAHYHFSNAYGSDDKQQQYATFGQIKIPILKPFDFVAGLRWATSHNHLKKSDTDQCETDHATVSSLELDYHFNTDWLAYIRRSGTYRFPKVDEETRTLNNQSLKTQTGASYETGISFHHHDDIFHIGLYQLDLKNEIMYVPMVNTPYGLGYNENLDKTRRRGIIAHYAKNILTNWNISLGAQYVYARFRSGIYKNNVIPNVPNYSAFMAQEFIFHQHWHFGFDLHYIGPQYPDNDVGNQDRIKGYPLLNANVAYVYKILTLSLQLNNLTNYQYNEFTIMSYDNSGNPELYYYPAPGINGSINLTLRF